MWKIKLLEILRLQETGYMPNKLTFHKSLTETLMEDCSPIAPHLAVIVAAFEHLFQSTIAKRFPDKGPAQTWKQNKEH